VRSNPTFYLLENVSLLYRYANKAYPIFAKRLTLLIFKYFTRIPSPDRSTLLYCQSTIIIMKLSLYFKYSSCRAKAGLDEDTVIFTGPPGPLVEDPEVFSGNPSFRSTLLEMIQKSKRVSCPEGENPLEYSIQLKGALRKKGL